MCSCCALAFLVPFGCGRAGRGRLGRIVAEVVARLCFRVSGCHLPLAGVLIKYGASSPVVNDLSRPDRAKRARRRIILRSLARFALFRDWVGAVFVRAPGLFSYVPLLSLPKLMFGFVWHRRSYARGGWRLDLGDCRVVPHIAEVAHCCHLVDCWVISSSRVCVGGSSASLFCRGSPR